jgi:hypothetical protein
MAGNDRLDVEALDKIQDVTPGFQEVWRLDLSCPDVGALRVPTPFASKRPVLGQNKSGVDAHAVSGDDSLLSW